jgi:hypothetical protein
MRWADHSFRGVLPAVSVYSVVCGLEMSTMRRPRPNLGCSITEKTNIHYMQWYTNLIAALSQASGVSTAGRLSVSRSTASKASSSVNEEEEGQPLWFWFFFVLLRRTMVRDPCSETQKICNNKYLKFYVATAINIFSPWERNQCLRMELHMSFMLC